MKTRSLAEELLVKIKRSPILGRLYIPLRMIPLLILRLLYLFRCLTHPIQSNKVTLIWFRNEKFCCNLKALALALRDDPARSYDIVCILSKKSELESLPEGVRGFAYGDPQALNELASAKCIVMNNVVNDMYYRGFFKRKAQTIFETWHGSLGIKTIEKASAVVSANQWYAYSTEVVCKWIDYWISNSSFESEVYRVSFPTVNEILLYGHPRNDMLVRCGSTVSEDVRKTFGLEGKKILLYAPSHRDSERLDCYNIDREQLTAALHDRFGGDWVIMYRLHPRLKQYGGKLIPGSESMIDATDFPDIQDLMPGVDVMLTDFSSCIFDFMLTGRPGFIYAPDLEAYNLDRGFYYPLESTPFPIGLTNEELAEKIRGFDMEKYKNDIAAFMKDKGCMEDGLASERVVKKMRALMDGLEG